MAHLARFDALLAEQQWQEAVESIRQDTEASSGQLVLVTPNTDNFRRYVPLSTYRQATNFLRDELISAKITHRQWGEAFLRGLGPRPRRPPAGAQVGPSP